MGIYSRGRRIWYSSQALFQLRAGYAQLKRGRSRAGLVRTLLVSDGVNYTSEQQFAPILRNAALLRDRCGVISHTMSVKDALAAPASRLADYDLIGLKLSFTTPAPTAEAWVRSLYEKVAGAPVRLVYFDGDDDANVQWPAVLRYVDLYVKKHVFSDPEDYTRSFIGKSNLTDYAAREFGADLSDDIIPETEGVSADHLPKIWLGWNIGLDDKIRDLSLAASSNREGTRETDLTCRASFPPQAWSYAFRSQARESVNRLGSQFKVHAPENRVPQDEYNKELLSSKICVSPFGYGELCWRDFEAILLGSLLVKPNMGHLRTSPDVFVPGVTYAPVQWDYSDLSEVCSRYLQDDAERVRLVERARDVLLDALEPDWFADRFEEMLIRLKLAPSHAQAAPSDQSRRLSHEGTRSSEP